MSEPLILLDINPSLYRGVAGIGRYVRDLADALISTPGAPAAEFLHTREYGATARRRYPPGSLREIPHPNRRVMALALATALFGVRPGRSYGRPRVFHSPTGAGPVLPGSRLMLTIHDLTFLDHPEWHTFRNRFYLAATVPVAVRKADLIACDSDYVRQRVLERFRVDPARVQSVPLSVDPRFAPLEPARSREHLRRRFGLEGDFVLHVGAIEPRKNHQALVEAFELLVEAGFPGALVLVGRDAWHHGPIVNRIAKSSAAGRIRRLEDADDADLVALYSSCTAFAFPSLEEGFGLPLVEAMACGAACVAADNSSLAELGRGAAVMVPARDSSALAEALLELWRSPSRRADWAALGRERAVRYRREEWVQRMFGMYRGLLDEPPGRQGS